jgi:hypothetical protein
MTQQYDGYALLREVYDLVDKRLHDLPDDDPVAEALRDWLPALADRLAPRASLRVLDGGAA